MLRNLFRTPIASARLTARCSNRRWLSHVSTHPVFPAILHRFQIHRESKLYDNSLKQDDWEYEDGVEISSDGLVHAKINLDVSNGALFTPNTHLMQELTRRSFDNYLDAVDNGQPTAEPHYLSIPKGTPVPDSLTLFRERASRFTLQPSYPISLAALNELLSKFYNEFGQITAPGVWLDKNPYNEAFFDDLEDWTSK
ncbi:hypothetical protein A7D00_3558 [Trichophyton violaceum]|uniref:Tse2 ADP-ribosyltransferase toxin domain-containing protein n=1 Tax=Trichophyton violaceum TaxID=34388 RepID=A0A178FKR1_TRIVO|nr:hypothetical protein A7D00_3558 [Trichophyton violaceum]